MKRALPWLALGAVLLLARGRKPSVREARERLEAAGVARDQSAELARQAIAKMRATNRALTEVVAELAAVHARTVTETT